MARLQPMARHPLGMPIAVRRELQVRCAVAAELAGQRPAGYRPYLREFVILRCLPRGA